MLFLFTLPLHYLLPSSPPLPPSLLSEAAVGRADTAARRWWHTIGNGAMAEAVMVVIVAVGTIKKKQQSTTVFVNVVARGVGEGE